MLHENIHIEVEYTLRERERHLTNLPAEFRGLPPRLLTIDTTRQSKILLLIADALIKTGYALKNTQVRVSNQKIYT